MDSTMTIMVRVVGRQAIAELGAVAAGVNGVAMAGSSGKAAQTSQFLSGLNGSLTRLGKSAGWAGRQLTYNFSLPLIAAGIALFKANQNIVRSMTQVIKVYGDASFGMEAFNKVLLNGGSMADANAAKQVAAAERVKAETDALAISFELLSTRFGVHQEEVLDIAAAWASAGSAGAGLAANVRATLEAMILGEMDAADATEGLIAVQAVWGLSTLARAGEVSELGQAMAQLNVIENQTGIRFAGLIEVMQRAGGVARTAGMSIRELGAFAAALVPATGSAAQAGNALKTMISRLVAPTAETVEVLGQMGIEVDSLGWGSLNATEKILTMADAFNGLDAAAQNQVASIIASRWQVSRFGVLMADVANEAGYFNKAMAATADQAEANATYQRELMTVLESSPRKWDILTNAIRNSLTKAFLPLIPAIMSLVGFIAQLADAFSQLDPSTQKWILMSLAMLAILGPILQIGGAFLTLFGQVGSVVKGIAALIVGPLTFVIKLMVAIIAKAVIAIGVAVAGLGLPLWAVVAIIAAIVAAIIVILDDDLRGSVWNIMKDIARAFSSLPRVIVSVFNAIIRIIAQAINIIREALSYLNPFARHSPSLVDNVRAGVATILDEYSKFRQIPEMIRGAISALNAFGKAAQPGARGQQEAELQTSQQTIARNDPTAGAAAATMIPQIMGLQDQLAPLAQEIAQQETLVARWAAAVNAANVVLKAAQSRLDSVTVEYERVGDAIQAAKDRIDDFSNAKLTGMQAMEDTLFGITMQQAELNLELVNFERQGYTIDSIREKYAALNGEIEMLRGEQAQLRTAGAGSDVLSVYDDQIAAIEAQRESMGGVEQQILDIQKELENLDLEKRFQELTGSITFDPLLKQIDEMVNGVAEMDFDTIIAGIEEQQMLLAELQPQYDALGFAVAVEEANVLAVTAARDALQVSLDSEQARLDQLNEAYTGIKNLINEMTAAMGEYARSSQAAADAAAAAGGAGGGGLAEGDYATAGGSDVLGAEGGQKEIEEYNKWLEDEITKMLEGLGTIDIFGALKDSWNSAIEGIKGLWEKFRGWWDGFWKWVSETPLTGLWIIAHWESVVSWFTDTFIPAFMGVWNAVAGFFDRTWDTISEIFMSAWGWISEHVVPVVESFIELLVALWEHFGPLVMGFLKGLAASIVAIFIVIKTAIRIAMIAIETIVRVVMNALRIAWGVVWDLIGGIVVIAWDLIKVVIESALLIVMGIFDFFSGLLTGDWDKMWQGIVGILEGVWLIIAAIFTTALELVVQIIETAFRIVVGIFEFLVETVIMLVEGLWKILMLVVEGGVQFIVALVVGFSSMVVGIFTTFVGIATAVWNGFWGFLQGLWNVIATVAGATWEAIKTAVMSPIDTLVMLLSGAWEGIKVAAKFAWDVLYGVAFTAWESIKAIIMGPINTVKTLLQTAWDGIKSAAETAWGKVRDAIQPIIDKIVGFIQGIIDKAKSAIDWMGKVKDKAVGWLPGVGNEPGDTKFVPFMASGGIIDRATLAVVGEAGREVIIPLTRPARALQLAQQSGLFDVLMRASNVGATASSNFTRRTSDTSNFTSAGSNSTTTVIQINGNLEFPNITNAVDAERFIANLESLAS